MHVRNRQGTIIVGDRLILSLYDIGYIPNKIIIISKKSKFALLSPDHRGKVSLDLAHSGHT